MSAKRDRRRQERRRHHQSTQQQQRRQRERHLESLFAAMKAAYGELRSAAADEAVAPAAFADQLIALHQALGGYVLDDAEASCEQGQALGLAVGDGERARLLLAEIVARAAGEARLVWLAWGFADAIGADEDRLAIAEGELARLDRDGVPPDDERQAEAALFVAMSWTAVGRTGDALELLDARCAATPSDVELQERRAVALRRTEVALEGGGGALPSWTLPEGEQLERSRRSLRRFGDRSLLYELREAVEAFVAAEPELATWRDARLDEIESEVREAADLGPFDELLGDVALRVPEAGEPGGGGERLRRFFAEALWLSGPDDDREDAPDDDSGSVLSRFAGDTSTPAHLAAAALDWQRNARYGLWRPSVPDPGERAPWPSYGEWVSDLVTRRRCFVAFAPEQLAGLARWSVLAGVIAPVEGVWRSGESLLALDPDVGDHAVEATLETADALFRALAREHGIKAPGGRRRSGSETPAHGVLADLLDPMEEAEADITAKVLSVSLPDLVGLAERSRRRGPALRNTDGEPLELSVLSVATDDPARLRGRLVSLSGFEVDDEGPSEPGEGEVAPPLRWLGRQMTATEVASSRAQLSAEARRRGWGKLGEVRGPQRYLRAVLRFEPGRVWAEVNSRRRLEQLSEALRRAGAGEIIVERQLDLELDLPAPGRVHSGAAPGDGDPEVEAAWRRSWYDEKLPALGGATPRAAAADPKRAVRLERLLRSFEYGADLAAAEGRRPLDVAAIRAELDMTDGVLGLGADAD